MTAEGVAGVAKRAFVDALSKAVKPTRFDWAAAAFKSRTQNEESRKRKYRGTGDGGRTSDLGTTLLDRGAVFIKTGRLPKLRRGHDLPSSLTPRHSLRPQCVRTLDLGPWTLGFRIISRFLGGALPGGPCAGPAGNPARKTNSRGTRYPTPADAPPLPGFGRRLGIRAPGPGR